MQFQKFETEANNQWLMSPDYVMANYTIIFLWIMGKNSKYKSVVNKKNLNDVTSRTFTVTPLIPWT